LDRRFEELKKISEEKNELVSADKNIQSAVLAMTEVKKQIENAPEEITSLIANPNTDKNIVDIGQKNELADTDLSDYQTETWLMLLGLTHPNDYESEIKNNCHIDEEAASKITKEIISKILTQEIREKLLELYKKNSFVENTKTYYSEKQRREIKNKIIAFEPEWEQNINFIVSSGDYSVFVSKEDYNNIETSKETSKSEEVVKREKVTLRLTEKSIPEMLLKNDALELPPTHFEELEPGEENEKINFNI
jgi:hypothetical protein